MKRSRWIAIALAAILVLSAVSVVYGIVVTEIPWFVFGGGGARSSGGDVDLNATLGQTAIGLSSSGGVELSAGYWAQPLGVAKIYLPIVKK